jgi:hypothetical protein
MPLHIEISGDASAKEWRALAALTAVMLGEGARAGVVATHVAVVEKGDSEDTKIGVDADRPKVPPVPGPSAMEGHDAEGMPKVPVPPVPEVSKVPTPPVVGVPLDVNGLPWDGRIHASTKTRTAKDAWTAKRGVDANLVKHVEAELRAILAAPGAPAVAEVPAPPTTLDPAAAFGGGTPTPSVPLPPTEQAPATHMAEFARVMRLVSAKQAAGTLVTEQVSHLCQQLGLTKSADLMTRPDLIPAFEAMLP